MQIEELNGNATPPGAYARHLVPLLTLIEGAQLEQVGQRRETCGACGCLCRALEVCPECTRLRIEAARCPT